MAANNRLPNGNAIAPLPNGTLPQPIPDDPPPLNNVIYDVRVLAYPATLYAIEVSHCHDVMDAIYGFVAATFPNAARLLILQAVGELSSFVLRQPQTGQNLNPQGDNFHIAVFTGYIDLALEQHVNQQDNPPFITSLNIANGVLDSGLLGTGANLMIANGTVRVVVCVLD